MHAPVNNHDGNAADLQGGGGAEVDRSTGEDAAPRQHLAWMQGADRGGYIERFGEGIVAVAVEDDRGVEKSAIRCPLEEGAADENDAMPAGGGRESGGGRTGDRLGAIKGGIIVLSLAEVGAEE